MKFRILHVDDSPRRIARGVAVGLFVAWSPFYGFHLLLSLLLATIFKANKIVSMLFVWVSNAFTLIPIYYPSYLIGRLVVGVFKKEGMLSSQEVANFLHTLFSPKSILIDVFTPHFWKEFVTFFLKIGFELTVGGIILGGILGILFYWITYKSIIAYRRKHPHKRFRKHLECA